jgi:hypothetical protein
MIDYGKEGVIWHQHSNKLMLAILDLWHQKEVSVFDLGAGHGYYVSTLSYLGYDAHGYDITNLGNSNVHVRDISKPLDYDYQKDRCLSFEVGEHIPLEQSKVYLDNLALFDEIIMSWAVPNQEGIGHINCQSNQWVINEMAKRGKVFNKGKTAFLREYVKGCHCTWFQNTLMYFHS